MSPEELATLRSLVREMGEVLDKVARFRQADMGHGWLTLVGLAETIVDRPEVKEILSQHPTPQPPQPRTGPGD